MINRNDIKYIFKRVIIFFIIFIIFTFINIAMPKAATVTSYNLTQSALTVASGDNQITVPIQNAFNNLGKGKIIFNFRALTTRSYTFYDIILQTGSDFVACEKGSVDYNGNINTESNFYTSVSCDVNLVGKGVNNIYFRLNGIYNNPDYIYLGYVMTFISDDLARIDGNVQLMQAQLATIDSRLNNGFNDIFRELQNQNSKTQEQIDTQKETNKKLDETNDFLSDTSAPSSSDMDFSSNNASNGVISDLVTMPITLTRSFLNGFNSSCKPFNLGNLLGTDLTLPCINLSNILGPIWNIIDVIISGVFIYTFGKKCVKIFNDITNMKENQIDEVFD